MEFQPVRKVIHRANIKRVGYFPSDKCGRLIGFESLLEQDMMFLLEYDKKVISFCEQPLKIKYIHKGKTCYYYPDIAVQYNNKVGIIEVKPKDKLSDPKLQPKFAAGITYCKSQGFEFIIATDEQINTIKLRNIKKLFSYRRVVVPTNFKKVLFDILRDQESLSIQTLKDMSSTEVNCSDKALSYIYSLMYHQAIAFDIDIDFNLNSHIWLAERCESYV